MQLKLGDKIRELRRRDGRTQEALADALGVTGQAVSRWESGGSYPDVEMIPGIANFFGISIDELFGYQGDRERKINELLAHVDELDSENGGIDVCLDECIKLLRDGLVEFPGNERITLRLACLLSEAGWIRHGERSRWNEEGYSVHDMEYHKECGCWQEAIKLLEHIVATSVDGEILQRAKYELILLYRNFGEYEKSIALAESFPGIRFCRQNVLPYASDGKEHAEYLGEALLAMVSQCSEKMIHALMADKSNFESRAALENTVETIKNAIRIYDFVCTDGNYGLYNASIATRYLYLSEQQWRCGLHDEAFESLERALEHGRAYEAMDGRSGLKYTAPLIKHVEINPENDKLDDLVCCLPRYWPWCQIPNCTDMEEAFKADPRWDAWVRKCQG